jgi:hypothetical protein
MFVLLLAAVFTLPAKQQSSHLEPTLVSAVCDLIGGAAIRISAVGVGIFLLQVMLISVRCNTRMYFP